MKQLGLRQLVFLGLLQGHFLYCSAQEFEVASIKPSPEMSSLQGPVSFGPGGGPGTGSPVRYWCNFCELSELVSQAYGLPEYRTVSTKRMSTDRFHVVATIAPGTTRDHFQSMLQHLLVERFGLQVHHEMRETRAYRLLIARGGAKLRPHVEGAPVEARSTGETVQPGYYYHKRATLADFAKVVENQLQKPVVDATGLTGEYDFDLSWSDNDLDTSEQSHSDLPTLTSAIRSLGLTVDSHREQIDVIVIDSVSRSPTKD